MSIEVRIRKPCDYWPCQGGFIESTKKNCEYCKGTGYVEEWEDLEVLIKKTIHIGE